MQELTRAFVPAADEVSRLQRGEDADSRFFQSFCEEGHYGGRAKPSRTRQGIYAIAPSGRFLASANTRDSRAMEAMLRQALAAWDELAPEQRRLAPEQRESLAGVRRWRDLYPEDGLVLEVTSRDLGASERGAEGWHAHAWNRDYAWFHRAEARALVPATPQTGARHDAPRALVERLVRFHLVDNVRGQTTSYPEDGVERAELSVEVVRVEGHLVTTAMTGSTRATRRGAWPVQGFRDNDEPAPQELGFEAELRGEATFDLQHERFVAFEIVASGTRWGGTQFNSRGRDLEPAPIGVVLRLAPPDAPRVAPAAIWSYGWRR